MKFITLTENKSRIRVNFDLVKYYKPHPEGSVICFYYSRDEWHIIYVDEVPEEIDNLLDSK